MSRNRDHAFEKPRGKMEDGDGLVMRLAGRFSEAGGNVAYLKAKGRVVKEDGEWMEEEG